MKNIKLFCFIVTLNFYSTFAITRFLAGWLLKIVAVYWEFTKLKFS